MQSRTGIPDRVTPQSIVPKFCSTPCRHFSDLSKILNSDGWIVVTYFHLVTSHLSVGMRPCPRPLPSDPPLTM